MTAGNTMLEERKAHFVAKAHTLHDRRYSYEVVDYVNNKTPVVIVCSRHARPFAFPQTPHDHLKGNGCPSCGGRAGSSPVSRSRTFFERARRIHGDRYSYDTVEYVDAHTSVIITCAEHGPFLQRPTKHLQGSGCHACTRPARPQRRR